MQLINKHGFKIVTNYNDNKEDTYQRYHITKDELGEAIKNRKITGPGIIYAEL